MWQQRVVCALVLALGVFPFRAAETATQSEAAQAVRATVDVEQALLEEDLTRHRRLALERGRSLERLRNLYRSLDVALLREDPDAAKAVEEIMEQVEGAERDRSSHLGAERLLVERIRDRLRRISLLEEQLRSLEQRTAAKTGPLEGDWTVAMLPTNQRGAFTLRQSGTMVTGTYELDGGWTGSLQGTIVDRKVHLVRIDSKLGRSMEFEGYLSRDKARIRGSWLSYDLSGDSAPSGHWSAVRSASTP